MPGTKDIDQIFSFFLTYINSVHYFGLGYFVNIASMVILYDVMMVLQRKMWFVSNLKLFQRIF